MRPLYDTWRASKDRLEQSSPTSLRQFTERLVGRLSVETGILERLYDLDRGPPASCDRGANVARARATYKSILDRDPDESCAAWAAGVCGYANSLTADPNAAPAEFERSLALLDALVGRLRQTGDVNILVIALSCYNTTLEQRPPATATR